MKDGEADGRTILETELIFGVRRRERLAWGVAIGGVLVGLGGVAVAGLTLPLKETQAFVTIVDKDTGLAERAVRIEAAGVEQGAAVEQSLLYNYVKNRETYDEADNEARILRVYRMSATRVQAALKAQWDKTNPNYPPLIYGASGKVIVDVLAITPLGAAWAPAGTTGGGWSIVIAALVYRSGVWTSVANSVTAIGLTIPSFALIGLLIAPVGYGVTPAVIVVTFFATLPILRNAVVGLASVPSATVESAG